MNFKSILIAFLFLLTTSCKKAKEPSIPEITVLNASVQATQISAEINFQLSDKSIPESGIFLSTDSVAIANNKKTIPKLKGVTASGSGQYSTKLAGLSSFTTYWYRIYYRDADGTFTYLPVQKFITSGFSISWKADTHPIIKLEDYLYRDILLKGKLADTDTRNYKVMVGNFECHLWKIAQEGTDDFIFYIQVPPATPVGKFVFTVSYLNKPIFSDFLEVLKGNMYGLKNIGVHPTGSSTFYYFPYQGKIYTVRHDEDTSFDRWDPLTNTWEHLGFVPESAHPAYLGNGYEINNTIWFPPVFYNRNVTIMSYEPASNTWKDYTVFRYKSGNDFLTNLGNFTYKGKFYCLSRQTLYSRNPTAYLNQNFLHVFNPANKSWEMVMQLDDNVEGYSAIAVKDDIYLIAAEKVSQGSSYMLGNTMYKLNLSTKTLEKKASLKVNGLPAGSLKPSLVTYNDRVYLYGGYGSDYGLIVYTDMYEYAPETDKWTRILLNQGSIGGYENLFYALNNKIYFGFGLTSSLNRTKQMWELDMSK